MIMMMTYSVCQLKENRQLWYKTKLKWKYCIYSSTKHGMVRKWDVLMRSWVWLISLSLSFLVRG